VPRPAGSTEPLTRAEETVIAVDAAGRDGRRRVGAERPVAPAVVPTSFDATTRKWYVDPARRPVSRSETPTGLAPEPAERVSCGDP
jgi:hypothetical protein